jgi:hypothetical protein
MVIQAIQTEYNGYLFRSRLEARWAVFFDTLGLPYNYEHEGFDLKGFGYYLPDFWLPDLECFAEVKPTIFTKEEYYKCDLLPKSCLLLDTGYPKVAQGYYLTGWSEADYTDYLTNDNYGRVLLPESKGKGRLWFLWGECPDDYWLDFLPESAAKQARFEHGESP